MSTAINPSLRPALRPALTGDASRAEWHPTVNPWMVALSVMLATFMVVLD